MEQFYEFVVLWLYSLYLEYMEFTAGLGAQDARLTCFIPGNNGENRQPGDKKYNRSGSHGENDAFTKCCKGETSSLNLPDSSLSIIYAQYSPIQGLFLKIGLVTHLICASENDILYYDNGLATLS